MSDIVGFEWSEHGLRLLSAINYLIEKNGGMHEYAAELDKEWENTYKYDKRPYHRIVRYWTLEEVKILVTNRHLKAKNVAKLLNNRSTNSVTQKRYTMIHKGLIDRKKPRGNLKNRD